MLYTWGKPGVTQPRLEFGVSSLQLSEINQTHICLTSLFCELWIITSHSMWWDIKWENRPHAPRSVDGQKLWRPGTLIMSHHHISVSNVATVYLKLRLSELAIQSPEANSSNTLQTLADCIPNWAFPALPKRNWMMYWLHMWVAMRQWKWKTLWTEGSHRSKQVSCKMQPAHVILLSIYFVNCPWRQPLCIRVKSACLQFCCGKSQSCGCGLLRQLRSKSFRNGFSSVRWGYHLGCLVPYRVVISHGPLSVCINACILVFRSHITQADLEL